MWILFGLLSPFLYGCVHILDSHCVNDLFDTPLTGMVTSALATLLILIVAIPLVLFSNPLAIDPAYTLMALISGMLVMYSQGLYFLSLNKTEAGIIAAYWNLIPLMVPIGGFIFLNQILKLQNYFGILLLVIASVLLCLLDSNHKYRWLSFGLMIIAAFLQSCSYILDDIIFNHISFVEGFLLMLSGYTIAGLSPLIIPKLRRPILAKKRGLVKIGYLFIVIEIIDISALMFAEKAIDIGKASLVSAFEAAIPAFTFILSAILFAICPKLSDNRTVQRFYTKLSLVGFMTFGIVLITL